MRIVFLHIRHWFFLDYLFVFFEIFFVILIILSPTDFVFGREKCQSHLMDR